MRTVKFNGIALGELSVQFLESPAKIIAKGAFINTESGTTHGWTTCHQWSPATIAKLKELRSLMEQDMAALHFVDASVSTTVGTPTGGGGIAEGFKGLGERLGTTDDVAPQT